jgi:hypothetical protein
MSRNIIDGCPVWCSSVGTFHRSEAPHGRIKYHVNGRTPWKSKFHYSILYTLLSSATISVSWLTRCMLFYTSQVRYWQCSCRQEKAAAKDEGHEVSSSNCAVSLQDKSVSGESSTLQQCWGSTECDSCTDELNTGVSSPGAAEDGTAATATLSMQSGALVDKVSSHCTYLEFLMVGSISRLGLWINY